MNSVFIITISPESGPRNTSLYYSVQSVDMEQAANIIRITLLLLDVSALTVYLRMIFFPIFKFLIFVIYRIQS